MWVPQKSSWMEDLHLILEPSNRATRFAANILVRGSVEVAHASLWGSTILTLATSQFVRLKGRSKKSWCAQILSRSLVKLFKASSFVDWYRWVGRDEFICGLSATRYPAFLGVVMVSPASWRLKVRCLMMSGSLDPCCSEWKSHCPMIMRAETFQNMSLVP